MELEKAPSLGGDRRKNSPSARATKATQAVKDVSTDHALILLLQALTQMSEEQERQQKQRGHNYSRTDVIHAVDIFFDTILSSVQCSSAVKALIGTLHIPVLKSASKNGKFFSDARHPARRLIKALYLAASELDDTVNIESNPRYVALLDIVNSVVKDYESDERIFLQAYFDVCQLA